MHCIGISDALLKALVWLHVDHHDSINMKNQPLYCICRVFVHKAAEAFFAH